MRADAEAGLLDLRYARNACDDCSQALSALGEALVASGREGEARQLLHLMQARRRDGYFPATAVAAVHNALGETDAALAMLERGHEERDVGMTFLRMERRWHNLRDDPRFQEFERRMGFARSPVIAAEPAAPESLEALK